MSTPNSSDPSGFLNPNASGHPQTGSRLNNNPQLPSVVKIVGTAREDLNGLLGFCTAYNRERDRYMVRMAKIDPSSPNATVMALKPANLAKGSAIEGYKARFWAIVSDPAVRSKLTEYYNLANQKCHPYKAEHVAGGGAFVLLVVVYLLGFTRTLMILSATVLIGCLLVEDVLVHRKPWREVARNLPYRSKTFLEDQFPFVRGKISETVAAGIVGLLLAFTVQSVFLTSSSRAAAAPPPLVPPVGGNSAYHPTGPGNAAAPLPPGQRSLSLHKEILEEFYELGFRDSLDGKDRGHSFSSELQKILDAETDDEDLEPIPEIRYTPTPLTSGPPPPSTKSFASRLVNVRTAGSIFYLYRMAMQVGVDPATGIFSVGQLAANFQHRMPSWQKAMVAVSCFGLFSNLFL
mmetsp:Transcript_11109/g.23541  ORF Transcript_11109/g.23541 Transcript_11109/m.23541 type:complete len:405 (+) Transcript_11109:137-1351(+)